MIDPRADALASAAPDLPARLGLPVVAGPVALGAAIVALPLVLQAIASDAGAAIRFQNDDAMRLVQVRDLLASQGWFDLTQYRLGLEGGAPMHWSRLIDAPIAGLIMALAPILGAARAETAAALLWPLLLALPASAATAAAGGALAGRAGSWLSAILMAGMLVFAGKFQPGSFDHLNAQLTLLTMVVPLLLIASRSGRLTAVAGALVALSMSIGVETLPLLAVIGAFVALAWAIQGSKMRVQSRGFSAGLAVALILLFVAAAPPEAYPGGFCDALSRDLAMPVLAGSVGLGLAATLVSGRDATLRLVAICLAGAVAVGLAVTVAPACLTNPLAKIDPFLQSHWLDRVIEAQGLVEAIAQSPVPFGSILAVAALGAILAAAFARDRQTWALIAFLVMLSILISFWQVRAIVFAAVLCVLPGAVAATRASRCLAARAGPSRRSQAW